jgi:AraC-like DNA-binding protein
MGLIFHRKPIQVSLPAHGVFVLESRHALDFRMADHCHDFLEVFYVLGGAGAFRIDGQRYACREGDVVVVPARTVHRLEDDPKAPLALYGICVGAEVLRPEPALLDPLPAGLLPVSTVLAAQLRADLRRLLYEQTLARTGGKAWIVGRTLQLLAALAQAGAGQGTGPAAPGDGAGPDHRHRVLRYVAELPHRFFEATDLDETAARLGMSRRRFTQLFREVTGSSWSAHLTRLRLNYACQLLQDPSRSVVAVAFECGFEDLSSFYRAFKRQTGCPPNAWRQGQTAP